MSIPTNENTICTLAQQWVKQWYAANFDAVVKDVKEKAGVNIRAIPSEQIDGFVRGDEIVVRNVFTFVDQEGEYQSENFYNIVKVSENSGFRSIRTISPWEKEEYYRLNIWYREQQNKAA